MRRNGKVAGCQLLVARKKQRRSLLATSNQQLATSYSAFTLIEIMVVMGILVILAGILIPLVSHVRRTAAMAGEKLDFQTISTALENYRQDFGDYPRNILLPTWNSNVGTTPPTTPIFLTLASALLGPGMAQPQQITIGGVSTTVSGDGLDGPGSRTRVVPFATTLQSDYAAGQNSIQVAAVPAQWNTAGFNFTTTFVTLSPGQWNQEDVGVQGKTSGTTLNLTAPTMFAHAMIDNPPILKTATGKSWPAYLPADKFQVAWVDPTILPTATGSPYVPDVPTNIHEPVLLDRWGSPIQYFPRHAQNGNRMNDSNWASPPGAIIDGPLWGYSAPASIDKGPWTVNQPCGSNSIWDQRDGSPIIQTLGNSDQMGWKVVTWQGETALPMPPPNPLPNISVFDVDLSLAVKWMLGDDNLDNFVAGSETERFTGPYMLISAGPDGPNRVGGGFCNLRPLWYHPEKWVTAMKESGNIYNFDR
jgi:type II secretory pathway pseudopilin PulG